jgi:hypothetical protein
MLTVVTIRNSGVSAMVYRLKCFMLFIHLTFIGPCIVIYSYSTTNKMHLLSQIIYSYKTLYTWMMTKKEEQALLIFERKIFRRICGPKYEDGEWKIRTNRELEELNKGENTVKWIQGQRISWLGHLERMEEDRMPRKIFA